MGQCGWRWKCRGMGNGQLSRDITSRRAMQRWLYDERSVPRYPLNRFHELDNSMNTFDLNATTMLGIRRHPNPQCRFIIS
jgi:hypothetical protein